MVLHVSLITILNSFLSPSTDKNLPTDIIPKPTIFLPSINEVNHQQTATYLCLLENFFPDVIKVSWKEKNGNRVLPSQQGSTTKTTDIYLKFSWLTMTENAWRKNTYVSSNMRKIKEEKIRRSFFLQLVKVCVCTDSLPEHFFFKGNTPYLLSVNEKQR